MSLKRIVLVRHGETTYTKDGRFCGSDDPSLTGEGIRCAEAVADHLTLSPPDLLLSSPSQRAIETGRPVARRTSLDLISTSAFAETRFGQWEGRYYHDVLGTPEHMAWTWDPSMYSPPEGEAGLTVQARAVSALGLELSKGDHLAIFSHKGTIRLIYSYFMKLPASDYRRLPDVPPASITEVWLNEGRVVRSALGNVTHLAPAGNAASLRRSSTKPKPPSASD